MAILNLEYYTQKDLYSDGDIEEQMLKMAKEGVTCEELSSEQVSFPVIYHFSDLRANILNWYPIKKSDRDLSGDMSRAVFRRRSEVFMRRTRIFRFICCGKI